jgi:pyruvate formate lyase activating enzyme
MNPGPRRDFYQHIDAANIDLKAFTERFYHGVCFAELPAVLDTLVWLKRETKVWFEVTTLLIPGRNDSDKEVGEMCDWFVKNLEPDVPLHFTAFHPDFKMLDVPSTPPATLRRARNQARAAGIRYVYTGNVSDVEGQSTCCPDCGALLIERDGYRIGNWHLDANGCCESCGFRLPGHFERRPGRWGPRRLPLFVGTNTSP